MTIDRPPRHRMGFPLFAVLFFLCALTLNAQEIVLPDIVLHKKTVKNVAFQKESPDIGETWFPKEPTYRRIYAFPIEPTPIPWVYSLESCTHDTLFLTDPDYPERAGEIIRKRNVGVNSLTADNQ